MRATAVIAAGFTAVLLALSGCSAAEDAAQQAADKAQAKATEVAVEAAKRAACSAAKKIVADGELSSAEKTKVRSALDAAESAGVSDDVVGPLRTAITNAPTGKLPAGASDAVDEACAAA
jgi:outer membrane lipoprotein-sorting protein